MTDDWASNSRTNLLPFMDFYNIIWISKFLEFNLPLFLDTAAAAFEIMLPTVLFFQPVCGFRKTLGLIAATAVIVKQQICGGERCKKPAVLMWYLIAATPPMS